MIALRIFAISLLAASISISNGQNLSPRMMGGAQIDTMSRFPSSVNIQPMMAFSGNTFDEKPRRCSGSILTDQWVLTSADCVNGADLLKIDFDKLYVNSTAGSYSCVVNNDEKSVIAYPTGVDDMALIKIPFGIRFTRTVKPIDLSTKSRSQLFNTLAVSPGFDVKSDQQELTYSMMTVAPDDVCKRAYSSYDEFDQLCVKPYRNYKNTLCATDSGTALIHGWPAAPVLIGMYTARPNDCNSSSPSVFLSVAKYLPWIESIIGESNYYTTTAMPYTK